MCSSQFRLNYCFSAANAGGNLYILPSRLKKKSLFTHRLVPLDLAELLEFFFSTEISLYK